MGKDSHVFGEQPPEPTPLQAAQMRVKHAVMRLPSDPVAISISGYINGVLQTARLNAMEEFLTDAPTNATWTPSERIEALTLKHLGIVAQKIELTTAAGPKLVRANGLPVVGH